MILNQKELMRVLGVALSEALSGNMVYIYVEDASARYITCSASKSHQFIGVDPYGIT